MKYYYTLLFYLFFGLFLLVRCTTQQSQREKASDLIVHISDSIYKDIPHLPRLCDSLNLVSLKVDIGDCELHVEIEGKGDPVVLINGGPGGTHHYFHPWFSRLNEDYQIIYYDQRGTGQSDFEPGADYSFDQAVNDLEALRKRLGFNRWTLIGYSYGGGLAQYYTIKYPEHVTGTVLINALPMLPNVEFESDQEYYFSQEEKDRKKEIIKAYSNDEIPVNVALYNLAINGDWKRQRYLKPSYNQIIRAAHYEWVNDKNFNSIMSKSNASLNFENVFDHCPIPTLILEGGQDLTWGKSKHSVIRKNHPNSEFYLINQAGHPIFSETPEMFFTLVSNFISQIDPVPEHRLTNWKSKVETMNLKL